MWYVEAIINFTTGEKERYEGLTQLQSRAIHSDYSLRGVPSVRSGPMNVK